METINLDSRTQAIIDEDIKRKRARSGQHQEMTFGQYLDRVKSDPLIAQNSPSRLLEIIMPAGLEEIPEHERWLGATRRYKLFSQKLFGIDRPIEEVVRYFTAGAEKLSTGKQLLLLVGPPASGKSSFVSMLKRALENYSLRPVFMIRGCPMFEEPLHLLPRYQREDFKKETGIKIEGDLCPHCKFRLDTEYKAEDGVVRWWDFPVETFTFSVQGTRGIGSFEPSDEKSSDVTELVGRENIAVSSTKGPTHPLAFSLSGELEKSNRGLFEGRELIKADEKILWVFISAAEEKEIKVQGSTLPHISIDLVLIGHTNLVELNKFSSRQENEALHDRIFVVPFPYPIRVKDEVAVYWKLIQEESSFGNLRKCHIAPGVLKMAAIFAVLTRLTRSDMIEPLTKLKVYNGEKALIDIPDKDKRPVDIRAIIEEGQAPQEINKREGMFGLSSRDTLAALNTALVEQPEGGCLTPLKAVRALRGVFKHRMGLSPNEVERYLNLLSASEGGSVMVEFKQFVVETVQKAFLRSHQDLARKRFNNYIEALKIYRASKRKYVGGQEFELPRHEFTNKPIDPKQLATKILEPVEKHIPPNGVHGSEAEQFRGEVLEFMAGRKDFTYEDYSPLARAVDKAILEESRSQLLTVITPDKLKGSEEDKRAKDLFDALTEGPEAFCPICAREMIEKAAEFLNE